MRYILDLLTSRDIAHTSQDSEYTCHKMTEVDPEEKMIVMERFTYLIKQNYKFVQVLTLVLRPVSLSHSPHHKVQGPVVSLSNPNPGVDINAM